MTVSKFLSGGRTYLEEAAHYLDARGLAAGADVSILPYYAVNYGYLTKKEDEYVPWMPEGWAFRVRGPDGEYYDDRFLLRPCNVVEQVYRREQVGKGEWEVVPVTLPKFLHCGPKGADLTHFASTFHELVNAPAIMFHEKFCSAALAVKHLGVPSIALSGCTNWSKDRALRPSIRRVVELAQHGATIYVCFDADISSNLNVEAAARQLNGWIKGLRPDLTVVFPIVPEMAPGRNGWDDWVVDQGPGPRGPWLAQLQEQGHEITPAMPLGWLIETFGLSWRATKDSIEIEHTSDNYMKLLTHAQWAGWGRNIDGAIINEHTLESVTEDMFILEYEAWLQSNVFCGQGAKVRRTMVEAAIMRRLEINRLSAPHIALSAMEEVGEEAARQAALRFITEGLKVVGPMTDKENVETLLRMCRDLCDLWAVTPALSANWIFALVGPSGSGKSNWPERLLHCLTAAGVHWRAAQFPKSGRPGELVEAKRLMRDNLVVMLDEYNPADYNARAIERDLFTVSTQRRDMQRDPYSRKPSECVLRAGLVLTTVDDNRCFIRSSRDAGAERRFIVWEVEGTVVGPDGKLSSNRTLMNELSGVILRYGWQLWRDGHRASANEYSLRYVTDYVADAAVVAKISTGLRFNLEDDLTKFGTQWRMADGSVRFSEKMLVTLLYNDGQSLSIGDRKDISKMAQECGAQLLNKGGPLKLADGKAARNVLAVEDWPKWQENLLTRLR